MTLTFVEGQPIVNYIVDNADGGRAPRWAKRAFMLGINGKALVNNSEANLEDAANSVRIPHYFARGEILHEVVQIADEDIWRHRYCRYS